MKKWIVVAILGFALLAKSAAAFVGLPLLFSPPVVTTVAGLALSTWAAIAAGVGALVYTVGLRDGDGNEYMRVRVNPNAPTEVPPGWTAAGTPSADPIPPANGGGQVITQCSWFDGSTPAGNVYPNKDSCAQALVDKWNTVSGISCGNSGGPPRTVASIIGHTTGGDPIIQIVCPLNGNVLNPGVSPSFAVGCPPGYSPSGSLCTLTTPTAVRYPVNNRCGLKISGGVMTYDSRDPDCDGPPAGILSADGKTLQVTSGGNRVQVKINTDGSVSVTQWTPSPSGTTTTMNTAKTGDPASAGSSQIKSSSQSTTTATGDDAFSQSPSGQTPQFPDDYARDATVAAGNVQLSQINAKLADVKTQLTTDGVTPGDPTSRTQSEIEGVFFPSTFDPLKGWTMPARSVACPTWSFTIWSHSYTIYSHCGLIESQRAVVSTICLLVFALIALFIVLGA